VCVCVSSNYVRVGVRDVWTTQKLISRIQRLLARGMRVHSCSSLTLLGMRVSVCLPHKESTGFCCWGVYMCVSMCYQFVRPCLDSLVALRSTWAKKLDMWIHERVTRFLFSPGIPCVKYVTGLMHLWYMTQSHTCRCLLAPHQDYAAHHSFISRVTKSPTHVGLFPFRIQYICIPYKYIYMYRCIYEYFYMYVLYICDDRDLSLMCLSYIYIYIYTHVYVYMYTIYIH